MSADMSLSIIARELKKIREALERMSPPPPKEKKPSAYETRGVTII